MTRADMWQTSSWLHWLLPAVSLWRGTAVKKPSSRSGQLSLQGEEVWSAQDLPRRISFWAVKGRAAFLWLWWLQGWHLQAPPPQPTAELQESKDS